MKNILGLLALSLFLVLSTTLRAQDEAAAPPTDAGRLALEQADKDRPVHKDVTITKKITGRLPNGYKAVVTNTQRDDIYKIQKEYNELIELLKLRIELMEIERDVRVDALLTEEQIQKLRQSRGTLESEKKAAQKAKKPASKSRKAEPSSVE